MSQRGKVKTQYRRSDFWPQCPKEVQLHRLMLSVPVSFWHRLLIKHRRRVDSNVRFAL